MCSHSQRTSTEFALFFHHTPRGYVPIGTLTMFTTPHECAPFLIFLVAASKIIAPRTEGCTVY